MPLLQIKKTRRRALQGRDGATGHSRPARPPGAFGETQEFGCLPNPVSRLSGHTRVSAIEAWLGGAPVDIVGASAGSPSG